MVTEITAARHRGVLELPAGIAVARHEFGRPTTVYLGGGTPSVVPGRLLRKIIEVLDPLPGAEVTVEANPESTTDEVLTALAGAGATRISLGVQSTSPEVLSSLGRPAAPGAVDAAVARIGRSGIATYGVDLVYGAATETDDQWRRSIEDVLGFDPAPTSVSIYALTVEPGTALSRDRSRHPDEETLARRYAIADAMLAAAGYAWYEISNFARPGGDSRHNRAYWTQGRTVGFGASAHSHLDGERYRNVWHIDRYLERVEAGRSPIAAVERLSSEERHFESLMLAIRTPVGVPRSEIDLDGIEHLVELSGDTVRLNVEGRMLADAVTLKLKGPGDAPSRHREWQQSSLMP